MEGVGELGGRSFRKCFVGHVIEDGVGAFEQFDMEAGEETVEALVLLVEELGSELVFGGRPFLEGFDGDVETGFDALEVAVELVELVEGVDFVIEPVAFGHVVESFGLLVCGKNVAQVCYKVVKVWSWFIALSLWLGYPSPPGPLSHKGRGGVVGGVGMCV